MTITAIIVTHQSSDVIARVMGCIGEHRKISRFIVVDNASTDKTCDIVRAEYPQAEIIYNAENVGYGNACNQALQTVTSEFALIINPDATIDEAGIDRLLEALTAYPNAAIAAPFFTQEKKHRLKELQKYIFSVTFVSGALMLWRMDPMRKVGFFDPAFFLFYEDDDLSIRIRRAGLRMLLVADISGFHMPGKSCTLTDDLHDLKLQSSTWSGLYITQKYFGEMPAALLARWKILSAWLGSIFTNNAYIKTKCRSQINGARRFLHNPGSFR